MKSILGLLSRVFCLICDIFKPPIFSCDAWLNELPQEDRNKIALATDGLYSGQSKEIELSSGKTITITNVGTTNILL